MVSFRQDSNFHYLTEWPEPDAHAVIVISDSKPELHLFVQDRNEEMETWDGRRLGQEGALDQFDADKAYSYNNYQKQLLNYLMELQIYIVITQILHSIGLIKKH